MNDKFFSRSSSGCLDQLEGGLLGLLIGDALGVPYEFHDAKEIPSVDQIQFEPPTDFDRAHKSIPAATWSDDGAQALCLLASLIHCGKLSLDDFANRLSNWYNLGYMAVDYQVYDVGITTSKAIQNFDNGVKPHLAGESDDRSNGNGSLMRVLPLALWHKGSDAQLIQDAQLQSCVTHRHLRSQICCALYCLLARRILQGDAMAWNSAVATLNDYYQNNEDAMKELDLHIQPNADIAPRGSGYVVDSLRAARNALAYDHYEDAVRWAISLGGDTDTTACIVGGIVGLRDGKRSIPNEWQRQLRGQEIYEPLFKQFLNF